MRSPLSIKPITVNRRENLVDRGVSDDRNPACELAHAEFSLWMDVQLESLEERFRTYTTRSSLVVSLGR